MAMKRFIAPLILSSCTLVFSPTANAAECQPKEPIKNWVTAEYATAGNMVIVNQRRLRLNGIHAPQKERKQKFHTPAEPLAKESQTYLNKLLANHDLKVGIVTDTEPYDHFNRNLGHLFYQKDDEIRSIQADMIRAGFAVFRPVANNVEFAKCYLDAEKEARQNGYQLWDQLKKNPDSHFPAVQSSTLTTEDEGYRLIKGPVELVEKSGSYYRINLDTLGIRIPERAWKHFDLSKLNQLKGQTIEVRGQAYLYRGAMFMIVEHPYAFDVFQP